MDIFLEIHIVNNNECIDTNQDFYPSVDSASALCLHFWICEFHVFWSSREVLCTKWVEIFSRDTLYRDWYGGGIVLGVRVWKHPVISLYAYEGFRCFFLFCFLCKANAPLNQQHIRKMITRLFNWWEEITCLRSNLVKLKRSHTQFKLDKLI